MDITAEIHAARDGGDVRCGISVHPSPTLAELAAEFKLATDPTKYREVDTAAARRLIELILNQDLAYNSEIVPAARAAELADRFLTLFGNEGTRFFTNGTFHEGRGPKLGSPSASWNPMTTATFDTGILVIGHRRSGCIWVEDED